MLAKDPMTKAKAKANVARIPNSLTTCKGDKSCILDTRATNHVCYLLD